MPSCTRQSSSSRAFFVCLGLSLALSLIGCAAHRPPITDLRSMETRLLASDERSVFAACVATLQDMGYTVESSDSYSGILTASRVTQNPSDAMPAPPASGGAKKRMPTWEKVALVATGVVLVVGAAALIVHDSNDSMKHDEQIAPSDSSRGRDIAQHRHESGGRRIKERHEHSSEPPSVFVAVSSSAPEPPTFHEYILTIHLQEQGDVETHVRVSLEDSEFQGEQMIRSGPLDDPGFYDRFFTALDQSLRGEPEVQAAAR